MEKFIIVETNDTFLVAELDEGREIYVAKARRDNYMEAIEEKADMQREAA